MGLRAPATPSSNFLALSRFPLSVHPPHHPFQVPVRRSRVHGQSQMHVQTYVRGEGLWADPTRALYGGGLKRNDSVGGEGPNRDRTP